MAEELKLITMPVTGMTCANCAASIERNVRKLPGMQAANVNLASEKLTVEFNPHLIDELGIIARVEKIGYGVATGKVELPITGLRDSTDALALEKLLSKQNGVLSAGVSFETGRMSAHYIPGMSSITDLAGIIRKAGYELVQVGEDETVEDVEAQIRAEEVGRQKILLIIGLMLTIPLMVFSMSRDFGLVGFANDEFAMLFPATIVQFYVGWQYYVGAYKSLRAGSANMDVLIALGSSVAYFFSLGVTLGMIYSPNVYFETSSVIITLIMLGKFLEARARRKTSQALTALMELRPSKARVVRDGEEIEIPVEQVRVADVVVVRPGEKVPVDGIIVEGKSALDESMISGESMPVSKGPGAEVIGATINKEGMLRFEATKVGKNTTLAQIVRLVQEAQGSKAPIQKLTDRISAYFVPAVVAIAVLTFAGWMAFSRADWSGAMINAVAVLVIACPCALGLATPTAIMVGATKGAEHGILFRNSETIERAGRVKVVVLDKTGTITRGEPEVTDILPLPGFTAEQTLRLAGSAERGSEHPLGRAIVRAAQDQQLLLEDPQQFSAVSGFGIRAVVAGEQVIFGNPRMLTNEGVSLDALQEQIERLQSEGKTAMILAARPIARDNAEETPFFLVGLIGVADTVKPSSSQAVSELRRLGLSVWMITGDNRRTAEAVARQVGIDQVLAEVPPGGKAAEIKKLQQSQVVAMVGDGVNDAPALAQADLGIAVGTGSDVAVAASGITLIGADLLGVSRAISLSRGTLQTIVQNLFWAFFYNVLLIPIATLGFLMPMIAAGAMAFSSIFVVTNSLRLRGHDVKKIQPPKPLARQVLELTPYLVLPGAALGLLIALSVGWLQPIRFGEYRQANRPLTTYRVFIDNQALIKPGITTALDLKIVDQFGKWYGDYDLGRWGSFVTFGTVAVVSRDLSTFAVSPLVIDPHRPILAGNPGGGDGMGGGMNTGSDAAKSQTGQSQPGAPAPATLTFADRVMPPQVVIPKEGQYVAFISFYPRGSDEVVRRVPVQVGSASTPLPALSADGGSSQIVGDFKVSLKYDGRLKSGQYQYLSVDIVDSKGQLRTNEVSVRAGDLIGLYLVDEKLTTFLKPDFINRAKLIFSVYFPNPGKYRAWFEFGYAGKVYQAPFVLEVE